MAKQNIDFDCELPDGYRAVAFRLPLPGEHCLSTYGKEVYIARCSANPCIIVEPIPPTHRSATESDLRQPAEFSDDGKTWYPGTLFAFDEGRPVMKNEHGYCSFNYARVELRQPKGRDDWGEGYRQATMDDIGQMVEMTNNINPNASKCAWVERKLREIRDGEYFHECASFGYTYARIRKDAPQVSKKPREGWVNVYREGGPPHATKAEADALAGDCTDRIDCIFVREATPPQ